MNILVLSNLYPPAYLGGYELLCQQVVEELRRHGHQVTVLTGNHGAPASYSAERGVHRDLHLYLPFSEPGRLARTARWRTHRVNQRIAAQRIAACRPDIIFIWSQLRLTLGAAQAAEQSGVPVCYTFNDEHLAGYLPRTWTPSPRAVVSALADRILFQGITTARLRLRHTTSISRRVRDNLVNSGLPVADSRVIYQGIPIERFPCKAEPGRIGTPARMLFAGQLVPYKGADTLIEAAHRLAAQRGDGAIRVTIAGDGPGHHPAELRQLARSGPATIEFLGRVPHAELPALYRRHDLFVFPSRWQEPFGLTHLEAMASGLPVVSTADGGHGEFLRDNRNALLFPKGNPEALSDRISALLDDPGLGKRLALAARTMIETDFSLARYVTELEHWLDEVRRAPAA
jgi:glycogen(starch) synthase